MKDVARDGGRGAFGSDTGRPRGHRGQDTKVHGDNAGLERPRRAPASIDPDRGWAERAACAQRGRFIQSVTAVANATGSSKNAWCPLCSKIRVVTVGRVEATSSQATCGTM